MHRKYSNKKRSLKRSHPRKRSHSRKRSLKRSHSRKRSLKRSHSRKRSLKRSHSRKRLYRKTQKGGDEEEWWTRLTDREKVNKLVKLVQGFAKGADGTTASDYFKKIVLGWWRTLSEQNKLEYKTLMSVQTGSIKL